MRILNKEKLKHIYFKITGNIKNKKLKNKSFSIISNNCFAGIFYRNNAIEYKTPTCGLFFMADDYIKFIYNIKYYLKIDDITEIKLNDSKYKDYLMKIQYEGIIGKLDDIEIMFLHYKSINEAIKKWNRRKKRINWENIIFKFNDQNLCEYRHLKMFSEFCSPNKICFTAKKYKDIDSIQLKQYEKYEYVLSDVKEKDYSNFFNIYEYINEICGEREKNENN